MTDYHSQAGHLVRAFKQFGSKMLTNAMAEPMAKFLTSQVVDNAPAHSGEKRHLVLVPAPSSKPNFKTRGYSPAHLLAKRLRGALLAYPSDSRGWSTVSVANVLKLTAGSVDQAGLNRSERVLNLAGLMRAKSPPNHLGEAARDGSDTWLVVLIDDIVTTGSTLGEMNRSLKVSGWKPAFFLTFAETL